MKINIVITGVVNDAKALIHVWSYDFYDMTLATSYDKSLSTSVIMHRLVGVYAAKI